MPIINVRFPTDEEEERSRRFTVHKNYLRALQLFLEALYGRGDALASGLVNAQQGLIGFQRIVDQVDWLGACPTRLLLSPTGKRAGRYQEAFVAPALHGTTKVSDLVWPDAARIALALEIHRETNKGKAINARAVDALVSRSTSHYRFNEPSPTHQSKGKPFERGRSHIGQDA